MKAEKWYYAGQRLTRDKKLLHAWLPEEGDHFSLFPKLQGIIGQAYEVKVKREGDKTTVESNVKYLLNEPPHLDSETWRSADAADRTLYTGRLREARLKQQSRDLGEMTLNQIATQYNNLVGGQRPAFLAQVLSRLTRGGPL